MFAMGALAALMDAVRSKFLEEKENGLLERLEALPSQQVELRAKAKGEWSAGDGEHVASPGDLVIFSLDGNPKAARVGIVQGLNEGGLQVLSGDAAETGIQTIKDHQIRGYIYVPQAKSTFMERLIQPFRWEALDSQKRLIRLMSGLLQPMP